MKTERVLTTEEVIEIARRLESRDAVFSQLWQMGKPIYDSSLKPPTAAVSFDEAGQVMQLHVHPKFWKKQKPVQKDFVICHEMLHVILEHGRRSKDSASVNQLANNVAMDVVVNEMLVGSFGFNRKEIDPKSKLCWQDNVFKGRKDVLPKQTFEYYLMKLPVAKVSGQGTGKGAKGKGCGTGKVMDDHSKLPVDDVSKMAEKAAAKLSPDEKEKFEERLGAEGKQASETDDRPGSQAGNFMKTMTVKHVARKKKWETLIKTCLKKMLGESTQENWLGTNRRYCAMGDSNVVLPAETENEGLEKSRAVVYMFLDTSGSCEGLAHRFWHLALSIPRDTFDVRMRCFDTRVYEVNLKDKKLYGFGGTSFSILESHIQRELAAANSKKYPDGVFVITDGYGTKVKPEKPERWHVLLCGGDGRCFPLGTDCHSIREFE